MCGKCICVATTWQHTKSSACWQDEGVGEGEHKIEENKKRQRENISKQTDADAAKSGRKKCSEKSARKQR